jgi:hypothetical protein
VRRFGKLFVCAFLTVASSCTDEVVPTGIKTPIRPRALIVPPQGTAQLPTNDSSPATTQPLPTYANDVIVQVGVSGLVSMTSAPNTAVQPYNGSMDGSGIAVGGVWSACYMNVTFSWSGQGSIGPGPCLSSPSQHPTWGDTVLVSGTVTVKRGPGVPQYTADCNYTKCHSYSGSQSAWVLPLHVSLNLLASPDSGLPGARVSFYAGVNPLSIKGIPVPLKLLSWQWVANGGSGQTVACATAVNPCVVSVMESGTMQLTALANAEEETASASVGIWALAPPCPAAVLANHPVVKDEYYVVDPGIHDDPHLGRDLKADLGTAVKSARDGIVRDVQSRPTTGLRVIIESTDGSNRLSYYYHLKDAVVKKGDPVHAGDLIAHSGQSGHVTGPHLHFEEHINTGHLYDPVTGKTIRNNLVQPCTF